MSLLELRREYEREVIGTGILAEVGRACAIRARRYPPRVYGRSATWEEDDIKDLVQDVITDRLLGEHQIDYLFDVARTVDAWRALLDRQVRITLARRRVRTVIDNLLDRARRVLRGDNTVERSTVARQTVYSPRTSAAAYRPFTEHQVRRLAEQLRAIPRQPPGRGERAPSVYSKRAFEVLLRSVLREAPGGITVRDLGRTLELVLTDWVPAFLEQDEGSVGGVVEDPGQMQSARQLARQIVSDWSPEELTIAHGWVAGLTHIETARKLGVSRPTLVKRQNALLDQLRQAVADLGEVAQDALVGEVAMSVMEREVSDDAS